MLVAEPCREVLVHDVSNRRRLAWQLRGLRSIWPSDGNLERMVGAELVRCAPDDKCHRFSFFQGCFQALRGLMNPDCEASAAPLKAEAKAAPSRRQLRVDGHAVVSQ